MKRALLLAGICVLGTGLALAELGKSLTDLKILKNLAVVRETLLYNRTFVLSLGGGQSYGRTPGTVPLSVRRVRADSLFQWKESLDRG